MAAEVEVRRAKLSDLSTIIRLWRELIGYHEALGGQDFRLAPNAERDWRKYLRGHLTNRNKLALVAEIRGRPVGFLLGSIERRPPILMERKYGHISDAYVQEPERRKGAGKALVAGALRWFEEKRIMRVRLQTDARNTLGFEFWKGLGFQTTVYTMDKLL